MTSWSKAVHSSNVLYNYECTNFIKRAPFVILTWWVRRKRYTRWRMSGITIQITRWVYLNSSIIIRIDMSSIILVVHSLAAQSIPGLPAVSFTTWSVKVQLINGRGKEVNGFILRYMYYQCIKPVVYSLNVYLVWSLIADHPLLGPLTNEHSECSE